MFPSLQHQISLCIEKVEVQKKEYAEEFTAYLAFYNLDNLGSQQPNYIRKNVMKDVKTIVEDIKVLLWRWRLDNNQIISTCLYNEWTYNPQD